MEREFGDISKGTLLSANTVWYVGYSVWDYIDSFINGFFIFLSEEFSKSLIEHFLLTNDNIILCKMLLGYITVIFANFQIFMRFGERAEIHKIYAGRYGILKRELDLLYCETDLLIKYDSLGSIKDSWKNIAQDAPTTFKFIRDKARRDYHVK